MQHETCEVTVADEVVVIRRVGSTIPTVARILGTDVDGEGKRRIWLDRTIHHGSSQRFNDQWEGTGAVSTVLIEA